ncbi:glycosyltransferase family 4 protein [Microbulbifer aggregans]|nr:glycosyltransferase family 4 protein [Microbulbifer aggregans]
MPRVAIIEPVGGHGGMNYYDLGLLKGVIDAGTDALLYTSEETNVSPEMSCFVRRYFRGVWGPKNKLFRASRFVFGMVKSLLHARFSRCNIVHYHFFHYGIMELFMVLVARLLLFKVVVTAHDVESFKGGQKDWLAEIILKVASVVIVHNQISKKSLVEKLSLTESYIYVIPHGNYFDFIERRPTKTAAREALGIPKDKMVVLFFGQIKRVKGLEVLLNAWGEVVANEPTAHLVIAGKVWKDDFSVYQDLIDDSLLSDSVSTFVRYIRDEEVADFYCSADLVVLPYHQIFQSGVLLMAMSYGVPVLVSDIAGMMEVIGNDEFGLSFEKGCPKDLAVKTRNLLKSPDSLDRYADLGIKRMNESYSWGNIGRLTAELFRSL